MSTYDSIINVSSDDPIQAFTLGGSPTLFGPYSAPPAPSSSSYDYEPEVTFVEKSPVNSNGSWKKIKESGTIVMSPYFNRSTVTRNFVVGSPNRNWFAIKPNVYSNNPKACKGSKDIKLITSWTEQGDFSFWSKTKGLPLIQLNSLPNISNDVDTSRSDAVAAFKGGYDILTELAEGRKTVESFRKISSETYDFFYSFYRTKEGEIIRDETRKGHAARELLHSADKATRNAGRRWMAYRYAIMPLIYSYQDIARLISENGLLYKTFRSRKSHLITAPALPSGLPGRYLFERYDGTITVSSTIKAGYNKSGLSSIVANQVQMNPFNTAWELIPFSFVLDWFVNVGDFISSHTSIDFSAQHQGCTSIRKRLTREVFLVDEADLTLRYDRDITNPCAPNGVHFLDSKKNFNVTPLVVETIDHYDRTLFNSGEVSLSLHNYPLGDWRRIADSAALSQRSLKNLLRSVNK